MERLFRLKEHNTTVRTELIAGLTTFMSMSYVLIVVPGLLADAGMPKDAAVTSTILVSVLSTLLMALVANYPVALAPGLGLGAFFAYYVCGTLGLHWTVALGAVFFSGVVFLLLTISGIREAIINAVPASLKIAIGVGIGLYIAFTGVRSAGLVVGDHSTLVTLGSVKQPEAVLASLGFFLMCTLMAMNVRGAIVVGIISTTILSVVFGYSPMPQGLSDLIITELPRFGETVGQLSIAEAWEFGILSIIFTFTIVEMFDNIGILVALTNRAGLVDEDGKIKNIGKALTADALATIFSAFIGASTVTSYAESATGVEAGGKTGLTAVTVAALFLVGLLFEPLIALVPPCATAPALVLVGALMMADIGKIDFRDLTDGVPCFLTIIMMPLTYSIANGFAFGFISYAVLKTAAGRRREVSTLMWVISFAFFVNLWLRS